VLHTLCLQEFENLKESPSEGVYIYGLYLDGCSWSGRENKLVDSDPKKLYHPLPVLYVTGVQAKVCACLHVCARFYLVYAHDWLQRSSRHRHRSTSQERVKIITLRVLTRRHACGAVQDKKRGGIYECPCYRVKTRKGFNFITTFSLRTEEDKSKWTLRGVALLCSID
jgi:dynein heavy chain